MLQFREVVVYDLFGVDARDEKGLVGELAGWVEGASKLLPRRILPLCSHGQNTRCLRTYLTDNRIGSHLPYKTGDACLQFCSRTNAGSVLFQIYYPLH